MNQLLVKHSPPEPFIINAFAFFGLANSCIPHSFYFFHLTSLEVDIFLSLLLEDPAAIHKASGQRSQNTPFFIQYWGHFPTIYGFFSLLGGARIQKAKHTELCKEENPSQFRKYRSVSLLRTLIHVPNWT